MEKTLRFQTPLCMRYTCQYRILNCKARPSGMSSVLNSYGVWFWPSAIAPCLQASVCASFPRALSQVAGPFSSWFWLECVLVMLGNLLPTPSKAPRQLRDRTNYGMQVGCQGSRIWNSESVKRVENVLRCRLKNKILFSSSIMKSDATNWRIAGPFLTLPST